MVRECVRRVGSGYYEAKDGNRHWFQSGYEYERMQALDELGLVWWKNTKLRIPYFFEGRIRQYTPDFFVIGEDGTIYLEEVKGQLTEQDKVKAIYASAFCQKNSVIFSFLRRKELKTHPKDCQMKIETREVRLRLPVLNVN